MNPATKYHHQKQEIMKLINRFILTDDVVSLAKALVMGDKLLKENDCLEIKKLLESKKKVNAKKV
jgi:hypothetical protein